MPYTPRQYFKKNGAGAITPRHRRARRGNGEFRGDGQIRLPVQLPKVSALPLHDLPKLGSVAVHQNRKVMVKGWDLNERRIRVEIVSRKHRGATYYIKF